MARSHLQEFNIFFRPALENRASILCRSSLGSVQSVRQLPALDPEAHPEEQGATLFRWLFDRQIEALWRRSLDTIQDHPRGRLAVRLHLSKVGSELATVPWELLHDPETKSFLALSSRTPILRMGRQAIWNGRFQRGRRRRAVLIRSKEGAPLCRAAGVAEEWLRKGKARSAVAIPRSMADRHIETFTAVWIEMFTRGADSGEAVAEARLELFARSPNDFSWAKPLCFVAAGRSGRPADLQAFRKRWTLFGFGGLLWTAIFFICSRSDIIPFLNHLFPSSIAAFLGLTVALILMGTALQAALGYCRRAQEQAGSAPISLRDRLALRLPVPFDLRVQGRRLSETVFQGFNLFLMVVLPGIFHWLIFYKVIRTSIWREIQPLPFTETAWEAVTTYIPFEEAWTGEFRLGTTIYFVSDPYLVLNVPWVPFWQAWFYALATATSTVFSLLLIWRVVRPVSSGPDPATSKTECEDDSVELIGL